MRPRGLRHLRALLLGVRLTLLGLACVAMSGTLAQAQGTGKPEITWALTPLPPAMLERDGKIVGYGVDILDWFAIRLPDYAHDKEIVPLPRLIKTIMGPGTFCNIGMNPTPERKEFLYFTDAVLPHLPVSLIVDASRDDQLAPYMTNQGEIDLERMIIDGKLNGALRSQRSYGGPIDAILLRHTENPRITHVGNDANFLQLIALERMDWTLYLPAEAEFYRRAKLPDTAFSSWHIAGNDQLMPASIACSKTASGAKIVDAINALVQAHPDMPWTKYYSSSLSQSDQRRYAQALKDLKIGFGQTVDQ
ncbi:MAG: hypothetical protein ACMZ66_08045 [Thalassospira sp.]|uniref:hypothetical protein n=1 Tax=Thalassospira sp. TaxID=1912094 RepID=UPI003A8C0F8F